MQVVIDIPENVYEHIKNTWRKRRGSCPESYIAWGTPLPKGHGRLIKVDDVYDAFRPYVGFDDLYNVLCKIPTIIKAESEEK